MTMPAAEEMRKVFGLVGGIVAVFGCAAWRMVGAATPTVKPVAEVPAELMPAPTEKKEAKVADGPIEVPSIFAMGTGEPFRWLIPKNRQQVSTNTTPPSLGGEIGPLPLPSATGSGSMSSGPINPGPRIEAIDATDLRLTGVLPGKNGVVVIDSGTESYVVRKGERFGRGMVVATIGTDRVAVVQHGKRTVLVLGESPEDREGGSNDGSITRHYSGSRL